MPSNSNLSGAQFQGMDEGENIPLAYTAATNSSAKQAAAWRSPRGKTMPLSKETTGSLFQPFADRE